MPYDELMEDYKKTMEEYHKVQEKYHKTVEENKILTIENDNLKLENQNLKRIVFGSKRENSNVDNEAIDTEQCSLFTEQSEEEKEKELEQEQEKQIEEITVYKKKNKKEKKAGIKKSFLKNVPVIEVECEIENEEEKKCPECNSELKEIGKKIVRQEIVYIPARIEIRSYRQHMYMCTKCGNEDSEKEQPTFVGANVPKPLLTHSFVSPSLATEVLYQKFYMGVPFYRQEKVWDDRGLVIPRGMMANWAIKIKEYYLQGLYDLMFRKIKEECKLLHNDETTLQCNKEAGRKATSNSYMWVCVPGENEEKQAVVFKYSPSRSTDTAINFLSGFTGALVTDGYEAYKDITGLERHAECWAHMRRYFYESIPQKDKKLDETALGYPGFEYCNKLFNVEREIKEKKLNSEEILEYRKEKSSPILKEFYDWVYLLSKKVIVNKKLSKAITYAINQQKELSEFLNDGNIPLSNSRAERAIRPFAVHRKNWLFADSVAGAEANAVMYSFIESAKLNKLNIYKYINYLLEKIPQLENPNDEKKLEKFLPWSKELPEDILNFQGTYEELDLDKNN